LITKREVELTNDQLSELKSCFKLFDKDDSGSITRSEMEKALEALGIETTAQQLDDTITSMDKNGNGNNFCDEGIQGYIQGFLAFPSYKIDKFFKRFER
jgi:Ca2+-binding EF-hand superfamily protein